MLTDDIVSGNSRIHSKVSEGIPVTTEHRIRDRPTNLLECQKLFGIILKIFIKRNIINDYYIIKSVKDKTMLGIAIFIGTMSFVSYGIVSDIRQAAKEDSEFRRYAHSQRKAA